MAKWTKWRRLANYKDFFDKKFDNEGASCYELGIKPRWGKVITTVYVGYTNNEDRRMWEYGYGYSHLENRIGKLLKKEFLLYYRAQAKKTITQAKKMEKRLLKERYYAWNTKLS